LLIYSLWIFQHGNRFHFCQEKGTEATPQAQYANSGGDTVLETRNLSRAVMGKVLVNDINVQVNPGVAHPGEQTRGSSLSAYC